MISDCRYEGPFLLHSMIRPTTFKPELHMDQKNEQQTNLLTTHLTSLPSTDLVYKYIIIILHVVHLSSYHLILFLYYLNLNCKYPRVLPFIIMIKMHRFTYFTLFIIIFIFILFV